VWEGLRDRFGVLDIPHASRYPPTEDRVSLRKEKAVIQGAVSQEDEVFDPYGAVTPT
jgi:hypothetical protein